MHLKDKIFTIRNQQVMLDRDLAELYEVETKNLNKAVKRNIARFPDFFCFQLSEKEFLNLRCQIGTSRHGGRRYLPYVFTEQGVSMLSAVLKSEKAIKVSIKIIEAFVTMRHYFNKNAGLFQRVEKLEYTSNKHDSQINTVLSALETTQLTKDEGIFFEGQLFTAHRAIKEILNKAKKEVILIDNYIDEDTIALFSESKVPITFLTKNISNKLELAVTKFNLEFNKEIRVKEFTKSHDRFIILDKTTIYHIGASLKDAGKKWFAINKIKDTKEVLRKVE